MRKELIKMKWTDIVKQGPAFSNLRELVKEMFDSINKGEIGKYLDEMEANLMDEKVVDELEYFEIYGSVEELYEHLNKVEDSIKKTHMLFNQQTDEI